MYNGLVSAVEPKRSPTYCSFSQKQCTHPFLMPTESVLTLKKSQRVAGQIQS